MNDEHERSPMGWRSSFSVPRSSLPPSLPLDRARRLGRHVVYDSVDAAHFVDQAAGDVIEEVVRHAVPVRGHEISSGDGADGDDVLVRALIAHHADASDGEEDGEGLGDVTIEAGAADLI